jgi:hypothetical protein
MFSASFSVPLPSSSLPQRPELRGVWDHVVGDERDFVNPGEMIDERLQHAALALRLLLQLVEMLGRQIPHRARWPELPGQHPLSREDTQQVCT